MKNIQLIITIVFGALAVLGLFSFAGIIPKPGASTTAKITGNLTIWGTVPKANMDKFLQQHFSADYQDIHINYVPKNPTTFASNIIEALAAGKGPDMVILPNDLIVRFSDKIELFTPAVYTERTFLDTFIQGGEVFVQPGEGILALPFSVDPMVMYWNRDIFASGGIIEPPKYWDQFLTLSPVLTKKSESKEILQSAVAFGEFRNITHSKDILSMLMLQTGNPMVIRKPGNVFLPVFMGSNEQNIPPVGQVFRFYTDFADPLNMVYSWNRSLPESKNLFIAGKLGVYFGYASEFSSIREKNPNLNFDVALVPQVRNSAKRSTFARVSGLATMKTSPNKSLALYTAQIFSSPKYSEFISTDLQTPSPDRAVLSKGTADPYMKVFYDSALISKTWLDLRPELTDGMFQQAVESISSGKETISDAVGKLQADFVVLTQ